eukprot:CAMPEP_0177613806 /NCGR_PEP_ID=MMETSP0419_2-20121207/22238_1 /TAXON_ID=582737 /ORGANISM="Tetraselmis sp., Strain GSL018" /LENGTH=336 /DNA_ID=CAMNT_0019110661 /DNA_START=90 /DNA_END=1097 /DNA_ORIENTATION=+
MDMTIFLVLVLLEMLLGSLDVFAAVLQPGRVLGPEACKTLPSTSENSSESLLRLHKEKSYVTFAKALARKTIYGHGKVIRVEEGVKQEAPQKLTSPIVSRQNISQVLEPLIPAPFGYGKCGERTCPAGWADVRRRQANITYLSSVLDLKPFTRRIYIDGGARQFDSSVGSWFRKTYPQAELFEEVFAFEVDKKFGNSYHGKAGTTFLPCALWVQDGKIPMSGKGMLSIFGQPKRMRKKKSRMKRPTTVQAPAIDFSQWLLQNVKPDDFVVAKLDIEGAEHELLRHMIQTKTIFLLDEVFVECHWRQWSRARSDKSREDCVQLLKDLRDLELAVHEW